MNLIYIFADQWRRDALGIYNEEIVTPHMDEFARKSAVFDRTYSSAPLCSPHRACLLTGRQPISTGVFTNCKPGVEAYLREETVCVSDILKEHGFTTGYIGKWHLDKPDGSGGWDAYTPPGKKRHGFDFWYSYGACDEHLSPHYWNTEGKRIDVSEWSPEHETDVALDFLGQNKDKNFVLFLSYNPPHSPYDLTPEEYTKMYRGVQQKTEAFAPAPNNVGDRKTFENFEREVLQGYYGAVSSIDDNFGKIVEFLRRENLYEDTYIILSSDHGDMLGEHGLVAKNVWYEGAVGIPLIIGGGGLKAQRIKQLISSPDQTATILGLLGITVPEEMDGKDFTPLLKGERFEGYTSVMLAAFPNTAERIAEFEKHGQNMFDYGWRCIVTEKYKLALCKGLGYGEPYRSYLYDLTADPYENVCLDNPRLLRALSEELEQWCDKTGDCFMKEWKETS